MLFANPEDRFSCVNAQLIDMKGFRDYSRIQSFEASIEVPPQNIVLGRL